MLPLLNSEQQLAIDVLAERADTDILIYNAPIERGFDEQVISLVTGRRSKRTGISLLMVTEGGDADAAYRISRCLQNEYQRFSFLVSGFCKSAGTLVALGAHELIFADHGELGPLDVQMSKEDELWEFQSGLTVTTALTTLNQKALNAYENFFLTIKYKGRGSITLRTAAQVATDLAVGLYAPIFEQIDPMHVGEAGRSIAIANQYGHRLNQIGRNLKAETLERLVSGYMSHSFVIDFKEAVNLFRSVRKVTDAEREAIVGVLGVRAVRPIDTESQPPLVEYLSKEKEVAVEEPIPAATQPEEMKEDGTAISERAEESGLREVPAIAG